MHKSYVGVVVSHHLLTEGERAIACSAEAQSAA